MTRIARPWSSSRPRGFLTNELVDRCRAALRTRAFAAARWLQLLHAMSRQTASAPRRRTSGAVDSTRACNHPCTWDTLLACDDHRCGGATHECGTRLASARVRADRRRHRVPRAYGHAGTTTAAASRRRARVG